MIHEMYGRACEELAIERAQHRRTIAVLAEVASGKIALNRLQVNAEAATWNVDPLPEEKPADNVAEAA